MNKRKMKNRERTKGYRRVNGRVQAVDGYERHNCRRTEGRTKEGTKDSEGEQAKFKLPYADNLNAGEQQRAATLLLTNLRRDKGSKAG